MLITQSQICSKSHDCGAARGETPALFTNTSNAPYSEVTACTAAKHRMRSVTSSSRLVALVPWSPRIANATLAAAAKLISATATLAPCWAKRSAHAAPMPDAPPVINAVLPLSLSVEGMVSRGIVD